jgi:hypothetical protein
MGLNQRPTITFGGIADENSVIPLLELVLRARLYLTYTIMMCHD